MCVYVCVYSTMTSVRSGNTLLNQLTVKLLSPLGGDKAVDKRLALASKPLCLLWKLIFHLSVSAAAALKEARSLPTAGWGRGGVKKKKKDRKKSSSHHLCMTPTLWR